MIPEFATYLQSLRGYSENTIKAYIKDLQAFASFIKENYPGKGWSSITRDEIDAYIIFNEKRGLMPATTNRQLASISGLYRFLQRQGYKVDNPTRYESRRKLAETIPTTIPVTDIQKAYKYSVGVGKTMLGLLATTGIRIQELLDLTWEDIDFTTNEILIHGKGRRERIVKTESGVLTEWKKAVSGLKVSGRIFFFGQRTARRIIYQTLKPYTHSRHLNPHTIRHTFATQLALQGESTHDIANALGHKNIATSQKYIDLTVQKKAHLGISLT